jgi:Cu(I)/Ag(I) efflux system membrane fusion protein
MKAAPDVHATTRRVAIGVLLALFAAAAGYGVYRLGVDRGLGMATTAADAAGQSAKAGERKTAQPKGAATGEEATRRHLQAGLKAGDVDPVTGRTILYYHDPMVPASRFDKPGKSPFMDMMLSPVYAESSGDAGVSVSPRTQQSLGVRTAEVVAGSLSPQVSAVGSIAFNERDQAVVQARAAGFVERLHARATLDRVVKGQPLVDLYVPDWIAAQEEFLSVRRMQGSDMAGLLDAARQRMRLAGMDDEQVRSVEGTGRTQARTTLRAPLAGVLVEVGAREGMTVAPGATLFRISGLATVWANAEVPESQAALVRRGAKVEATSPALQGETFAGTVQSILPDVSATTRTIRARVELANPGARLVPGMLVQMLFVDVPREKGLLVPSDAVIQTGRRSVVIVAEGEGHFRPVEVETGAEAGGQTEIRRGLRAGQRVVVSSQFLIDSEASLRGVESRLNAGSAGAAGGASAPEPAPAHVHGAPAATGGKP